MEVDSRENGAPQANGDADKTSKDYYFDSYAHFGIHEEMLKDQVRTRTYMNAIMQNAFVFKDKVVLDVGCGTGILSLFCAKAGARHVYGIECSAIADQAVQIVKDNGYEQRITIIKGKVEEVTLPVDKVDIIVSEWMGYFLFYESMLDTVIWARDKWLAPGGLIFPDQAVVHLCAIEDAEYRQDKIDFWNDVYGFNFSCIGKLALLEPLVDCVQPDQICTNDCQVCMININVMKKEDAHFSAPFSLTATRNDFIHALVGYFSCTFSACHKPLQFTTGPRNRQTHWKQTVFYLETIAVCKGETLTGTIHCKPNKTNPRDLDITIEYSIDGKRSQVAHVQNYKMR